MLSLKELIKKKKEIVGAFFYILDEFLIYKLINLLIRYLIVHL